MISLIDRYLLKDIIKTMLAILAILILILLSNNLVKILRLASEGLLSNEVIPIMVSLEILRILPVLIPPAFFFATLYTLGRMYRDNEMTALAFAGLGGWRIYRSIIFVALITAVLVAWFSLLVLPNASLQMEKIKIKEAETAGFGSIKTAEFNELRHGNLTFYAEDISPDGKKLANIFIQNRKNNQITITTAKEGYQYLEKETGDRFIVLINGHRYQGQAGQADYSIGTFSEYGVRIQRLNLNKSANAKRKTKSSRYLYDSDNIRDKAALQWRLTLPLSVLTYALLCIPLSKSRPREGIYGRLFMAVLSYFIYINISKVAQTWMIQGKTPEILGMWWIPVLFSIIALFFIQRSHRMRKIKKVRK